MAAGLPDFTTPIDVAQQSLQEVTIRNKYGAPVESDSDNEGGVQYPAGLTAALLSISGQGILYGGVMRVSFASGAPSTATSTISLFIDGNELESWQISRMVSWNANQIGAHPALLYYNSSGGTIDFTLPRNITFESSLALKINVGASETVWVKATIITATV